MPGHRGGTLEHGKPQQREQSLQRLVRYASGFQQRPQQSIPNDGGEFRVIHQVVQGLSLRPYALCPLNDGIEIVACNNEPRRQPGDVARSAPGLH